MIDILVCVLIFSAQCVPTSPSNRLLSADLWKQVGAQWEKENEEEIKDKMDFLLTPPPFYPPGGQSLSEFYYGSHTRHRLSTKKPINILLELLVSVIFISPFSLHIAS